MTRLLRLAAVAVLAGVGLVAVWPRPASAQLDGGPCLPVPIVGTACQIIEGAQGDDDNYDNPLSLGGIVGGIGDAILGDWEQRVAGAFINAGVTVMEITWDTVRQTARPDLDADWFRDEYRQMIAIAAMVGLFTGAIACALAAARGDAAGVAAVMLRLPLAFGLAGMTIPVVMAAVAVCDWITLVTVERMTANADEGFERMSDNLSGSLGFFAAPLVAGTIGLLNLIAGVIAWLWFRLRDIAIYLAVLYLPVMYVAGVLPTARRWAGRMWSMIAALIVSQPVLMAAMSLAMASLGAAGDGEDPVHSTVRGTVGMLIAVLTPGVVFAFMPLAAEAGVASAPGVAVSKARRGTSRAAHLVTSRRGKGGGNVTGGFSPSTRRQPPPPPPGAQPVAAAQAAAGATRPAPTSSPARPAQPRPTRSAARPAGGAGPHPRPKPTPRRKP